MLKIIFYLLLLLPNISYSKTTIDSDKLDVNFNEKIAVFQGNVKISSDNITFISDTVIVNFLADNTIENINAKSSTRLIDAAIKRDDQTYNLQCKEISIDMIKKIITASNATLHYNNSAMSGETMIYNINNGEMLVSGNQQVKISIEDGDKETK